MNNGSHRIVRDILITAVVITFLVATVSVSLQITHAAGNEEKKKEKQKVTVEVVGEEPAGDIEESKVPLAASPNSPAMENTRGMIIGWTIAAAVLAYVVFILLGARRRKLNRKLRAGTEGDRGDTPEGGTR